MPRARVIALALLALVTYGTLLVTGGYAWYWRSDAYREYCAKVLSESLQMDCDIGQVLPLSHTSFAFRDIRVWLPERRDLAAACDRAALTYTPTTANPDAYEIALTGGRSEISARTWLREDYRFVVDSGLRPGFDPDGPRRVTFRGMDLTLLREGFQARFEGAAGEISFVDPQRGYAQVVCDRFNGHTPGQPVTLEVVFSPRANGVQLDLVELGVPDMPINVVGLADVTGLKLRSGSFRGALSYGEEAGQRRVLVSGHLYDVDLAELTSGLLARAWHGGVPELELRELRLTNGHPTRIALRGLLEGVALGDVLAPWGLAEVGAELLLRVRALELSEAGIERLILAGVCDGVSLAEVSDALGWGQITGTARLAIDDLTIVNNELVSLDARIETQPMAGDADYIERVLLSEILSRTLGIGLPGFLPGRLPYAGLGVRLEVRDELLYVFGTHGPGDKTILTARVAGQEIPLVFEPEEPIDLAPLLEPYREQVVRHLAERLRQFEPADAWHLLQRPQPEPTPGPLPPGPEP